MLLKLLTKKEFVMSIIKKIFMININEVYYIKIG